MTRLLFVILLGCALAMALIVLFLRPYLRRPAAARDIQTLVSEGEQQMRQGNVFLAAKALREAREERDNHPNALSRDQHHRLEQLWRQSDLLARLLDQPLEELLTQALQHRSDEEWRAKFEHYRGRTIVFDDVLHRGLREIPVVGSYVVRAGDNDARVALEDLTLLRQLPLEPPRRWLFGARLADCQREQGGTWVFHFEPDSAVLLSDEIVAAVCCPAPLDEDVLGILKRQDEWLRR